jgi:hypothetical protein
VPFIGRSDSHHIVKNPHHREQSSHGIFRSLREAQKRISEILTSQPRNYMPSIEPTS